MSEFTIGYEGKLYYLSMGTRAFWPGSSDGDVEATGAAPSNLVEAVNIKDCDVKLTPNEWDSTTRESRGFDTSEPTTLKGEITFEMVYDTSDAFCLAIISAVMNRSKLGVVALDGSKDVNGSQGFWLDCKVFDFGRGEKLKEGMMVPVALKPCRSSVHPQWVTTSGAASA